MASSNNSSNAPSRNDTPDPAQSSRFTASANNTEDLLKSQTVGLVNLSDFRKRRAEAQEAKDLGRFTSATNSGAVTPSDGTVTPQPPAKKKKKIAAKGKLSFAFDDDDDDSATSKSPKPRSETPAGEKSSAAEDGEVPKKRLGANAKIGPAPKVKTKSALLKETQTRETLRKEFLLMQEAVKATNILVPFVFYDGTNIPGGVCKVKKGDPIWLFLDRSRKVGAESGVGASGERAGSRREWARVGVDDLMLVRGDIIVPHHYEFYYFIVNKTQGHSKTPLFPYSAEAPTAHSTAIPEPTDPAEYDPLARPEKKVVTVTEADGDLEGANDDPNLTKVVDRRWYERNKHIFPASVWEEFDPTKDYSSGMRKDAEGNIFFF